MTSNASFLRSRGLVSLCCSTLTCECTIGRTGRLVPLAYRIHPDCTIHTPCPAECHVVLCLGSLDPASCRLLPRCYLTYPHLRALYISYLAHSCIRRYPHSLESPPQRVMCLSQFASLLSSLLCLIMFLFLFLLFGCKFVSFENRTVADRCVPRS